MSARLDKFESDVSHLPQLRIFSQHLESSNSARTSRIFIKSKPHAHYSTSVETLFQDDEGGSYTLSSP